MAEDVIKTLNENFFYSKKQRGYTFKHIYEKHIIGDISKKTGKMPFTLSEVLRAEKEGKLLIYGGDLIALWETDRQEVSLCNPSKERLKNCYSIQDWEKAVSQDIKRG